MQLVSSPSPLAGEGRERDRTSQLDPSDKAVGRAQPPHPAFGHPLPKERVSHPSPPGRRCRAAADEGVPPVLATPLTLPSRKGRGSQKSLRPRALLLFQRYCG